MQVSNKKRSTISSALYHQSIQEIETFCMPQFQFEDLDGLPHGTAYLIKPEPYCTLESSSANGSCTTMYNSPSTVSFSPTRSPFSHSPASDSCDDPNDFRHKLRQLETLMFGSDMDYESENGNFLVENGVINLLDIQSWKEMMNDAPRRDLKQVLAECAEAVSSNHLCNAKSLMSELRQMVSVAGDPIQRLGAYMLEGLVARLSSSGSAIYKSLKCKEPARSELLSYMQILYEVCPYFKFGYMSANGAIAEAMKDENRVHIIDFQIAQGSQWVPLIQAFAARPGGPPHIRITGFDDSTSAYARGGGLDIVSRRLCRLARSIKVPFEFHATSIPVSKVRVENFRLQPGEALAVNFAFVLHHLPDESVSTQNHRDHVLRLVKSTSPKVVTLVEQESNTNTAAFYPRFLEVLDYYHSMFESMDVTLPREHKERINVEQHCLARDVVNIIACEGIERVERHELLGKWKLRFKMAGFSPRPLSSVVNNTIRRLLNSYSERYRIEERDGGLYLGWMNRDLIASCAWK